MIHNEDTKKNYYRDFLIDDFDDQLLSETRHCVQRGLAIGYERFKEQVEQLTG